MAAELLIDLSNNGILKLTMNRPEVHNAFDDQQVERLTNALKEANGNPKVRVIILGSEGKSFSAGGDINYMRRMGSNTYEQNLEDAEGNANLMKVLNFLNKPTIARVQGAAMGGGVGLVCCCDYAIGTPRTRLALSEVKLGVVPAVISPYVVAAIGEKQARQLFMSGQMVDAEKAFRLGFISELVEEDQLDAAVEALAETLLKNAPEAIRICKQLVFDVSASDINDELILKTRKLLADVRDSDEGKEGLSAFLEKRSPAWQG